MRFKTKSTVAIMSLLVLSPIGLGTTTKADQIRLSPVSVSTTQSTITNISYDSKKGILDGDKLAGATSYSVEVDGNTFHEVFTVDNSRFTSTVSNDFYHAAIGNHTIKVVAYNAQHEVIGTGKLLNNHYNENPTQSTITNISYDSRKGILDGDKLAGATSYSVEVDGNTFHEVFTVDNSRFTSTVSNDFYHAAIGNHTIKVVAYNAQHEVIGTGKLSNNHYNENPTQSTITNISYDSRKGILGGDKLAGATSYSVEVDGNAFHEVFTVDNSRFTSTVSNDFYHAAIGNHTIKVVAYNAQHEVIGTGKLSK